MSGFDISHITVAYGASSFIRCNGVNWILDSSDTTTKTSAAWAGGDSVFSVSRDHSTIRCGTGSPGAYTWATALSVPNFNWKLRYLVCRLDGYSDLIDPSTGIPRDVKNMIDLATNPAARSSYADAKFILDGPHSKLSTQKIHNNLG